MSDDNGRNAVQELDAYELTRIAPYPDYVSGPFSVNIYFHGTLKRYFVAVALDFTIEQDQLDSINKYLERNRYIHEIYNRESLIRFAFMVNASPKASIWEMYDEGIARFKKMENYLLPQRIFGGLGD